jgi:hypothetical protein
MPTVVIVVLAALILCGIVAALMIRRSPEGSEDRNGFHFAPADKPDEVPEKAADKTVSQNAKP